MVKAIVHGCMHICIYIRIMDDWNIEQGIHDKINWKPVKSMKPYIYKHILTALPMIRGESLNPETRGASRSTKYEQTYAEFAFWEG